MLTMPFRKLIAIEFIDKIFFNAILLFRISFQNSIINSFLYNYPCLPFQPFFRNKLGSDPIYMHRITPPASNMGTTQPFCDKWQITRGTKIPEFNIRHGSYPRLLPCQFIVDPHGTRIRQAKATLLHCAGLKCERSYSRASIAGRMQLIVRRRLSRSLYNDLQAERLCDFCDGTERRVTIR